MTQNVKSKGVLYLEKNRLQIYVEGKPNVLVFDLSPTVSHDIEIFNRGELEKGLLAVAKNNTLPATEYTLILAQNILFEKDISPPSAEEIQKFLDAVPFEYISSRQFPNENGVRVVAANRDFYSVFNEFFEQYGSSILTIVPYFAVNPQMNGLDEQSIATVFSQSRQLMNFSLTDTNDKEELIIRTLTKDQKKSEETQKNNRNLFALLSVFVLLIGVLGFMLLKPAAKPAKPVIQAAPAPIEPTVVEPTASSSLPITIPPSPSVSSQSATIDKGQVKIQIIHDPSTTTKADALKSKLNQAGYKEVQLQDGGSINLSKPLVIFDTKLSIDLKNDLLLNIKSMFPDITTQESQNAQVAAVITIGK